MNENIKDTNAFKLKDLVSYEDGQLNKFFVERNDHVRFALMAYDKGVELSKHAACGDAIVFALEGNAIITYQGKEHEIKEGENFHFKKGIEHSIKAVNRFKMALVVVVKE